MQPRQQLQRTKNLLRNFGTLIFAKSLIFTCSLFCTLFVSLFLSAGIAHAENSSQTVGEKTTDTNNKEQSLRVNKKTAIKTKTGSHVKQKSNFIPSEKIKADSSIPFPVDI